MKRTAVFWVALAISTIFVAPLAPRAIAAEQPPVFALVIGIDAYQGLPPLRGAVNDAELVAAALKARGAREIVTLLDARATRAEITQTIARLAAAAENESGWLVVTYAGHGGQELARLPGDELDGKDEVLLLPGFRSRGPASAERLVDNEIYAILSKVPQNVTVLFVVDACHSGTMTRAIDGRASLLGTRMATYGTIEDDALPAPPPSTLRREAQDLPNIIFVSSALDSEVTPEVMIEGKPHGAVSWAFSRAIAGIADTNNDGATTLAEFRQYMVIAARQAAENRHSPGVDFLPGRGGELLAVAGRASISPTSQPAPLKVWTLGNRKLPPVVGAVAAASRDLADLIWDPQARQIISNASGDMIAEQASGQPDESFVAGVVDKWHALAVLKPLAARHPFPIEIGPFGAGARYIVGPVSIKAQSPTGLRYITVVNLAGDGTVQSLFPQRGRPSEFGPQGAIAFDISTAVQSPFGADHVVAIATDREPVALRNAITAIEGRQASLELAALLKGVSGQASAIGIAGLYTGTTQ